MAISSPGCEYQFGLFSDGSACSTNYVKCEHGAPYALPCEPGLAYDDRIKKCNWPDELVDVGCSPAGELYRLRVEKKENTYENGTFVTCARHGRAAVMRSEGEDDRDGK